MLGIPQGGIVATRRDLGSLAPHPASIGRIVGAHMGIGSIPKAKMHLAGGGMASRDISNAENIGNNMFQPLHPTGGIPNMDVNFITSPQLGIGPGPPKGQAAKPEKQSDPMAEIAQGTGAANGLTSLYDKFSGPVADLVTPTGIVSSASDIGPAADAAANWGADFSGFAGAADATATATAAASTMPEWLTAALAFIGLADGGAVPARADGGSVQKETYHPGGLLNSAGPGRTDTINTNVPAGAYVVPADVVSGIGSGNTLAGSAIIDRMFSTSPYGVNPPRIRGGRGAPVASAPAPHNPDASGPTVDSAFINSAGKYANGGDVEKAPVVVAGGEHVINNQDIINKFGSLRRGHKILDHWVIAQRERNIKEQKALAPPVGSRVKKK